MAIDPTQDTTVNVTVQRVLKKADNATIEILPDPDGTGRIVRVRLAYADSEGCVDLQFASVGTLAERNTVKGWAAKAFVAAAAAAGLG
jgi:hypothetical protein